MAMPGYDEESPICEARGGPSVGSPSTLSAGEAVVQNEPGLERRGSVDAGSDVPCSSSTSDSVQLVSSFSYRVASQQRVGAWCLACSNSQKVSILMLNGGDMEHYMHTFARWLFYSNEEEYFVSILKSPDEVSVMVSTALLEKECKNNDLMYKVYTKAYDPIQIVEGVDIVSACGIIHRLTGILSERQIPILYNSTLVNDYIFVEEGNLQQAKQCLSDAGLSCIEE